MGVQSAVQSALDDTEATSQDVSDQNGAQGFVGALASLANPTTTAEAQGYARKFLNKELSGEEEQGEQPVLAGLEKNAAAARAALQKARQSLLVEQQQAARNSERDRYLAIAQGFGAPTKSGSFFENLSDYAKLERERQAADLAQRQGFAQRELNLDLQGSDVDQNVLNARLQLQKLHEQQLGSMGKEALQTLGRSITPKGPGALAMSPAGKLAVDSGLTPGTPQFNKFVSDWNAADVAAKKARAGIDVSAPDPVAHAQFASSVGVPADVPSPWEGKSTKERTAGEAIEQRKAANDFSKYPEVDRQIRTSLDMLDQFQALNAQTHTGPELAPFTLGGVHAGLHGAGVEAGGGEHGWNLNPVSWIESFKPNIQSMNKISANLSTLAKPEGFGSRVTNFDLQTFQRGMVGIDKSKQTNDMIAQALRSRLNDELNWHEFEQNYFEVYGHRRGAEAAWNNYLRNNPIFDPTFEQGKAGLYKMNPHREDWKTWFSNHNQKLLDGLDQSGGPHLPGVTDEMRNDPVNAGLSDEEILAAKQPAQAHAEGGPIVRKVVDLASAAKSSLLRQLEDQFANEYTADRDKVRQLIQRYWQNEQPRVSQAVADQPPPFEKIDTSELEQLVQNPNYKFAEGGDVDTTEETPAQSSTLRDSLNSLRAGASFKLTHPAQDPEQPATNFSGETAGAAGVTAALLALSRLGRRVGLGGLSRVVAEHPNIASSLAGGLSGAVAGAASSKDQDPTTDALAYGLAGAAAGPLARYGGRQAVERLGALMDRLQGQAAGPGDRRVIEALNADNPGGLNDIAARLRADARMRVPSTLAEASGPRATGLATAALGKDTPETGQFADMLQQRQEGASGRVQDKINQALAPDPYLQKQTELRNALYNNASPLYVQAYKQFPAVQSRALMELMNTPAGKEAAQRAFLKMQNLQLPIGVPNATGMITKPSLQYLDYVKRAFDDMITQEEGSGANYHATDDGRILRQMRDKLKNEVDAVTRGPNGQPGPYQAAREQYAGDLEMVDALRSGNEDFKRLTPQQLAEKVSQMSYAERDAFRSGVAEHLFQNLGNTRDAVNPAQKVLATPNLRDKIAAIFEKPQDATRFMEGLQREAETFEAARPQLGAARRGQAQSAVPPSIAQMARARLMLPSTASDIATTLGSQGQDATNALNRLRDISQRLQRRQEIGNLAGTATATGVGVGMTPSNTEAVQ